MTLHILIVEDVQEKKDLVLNVVRKDFEIQESWAQSIAAAFGTVAATPPVELILLDMAFASRLNVNKGADGLAGLRLLQYIRSRRIDIPVIVATSHDSFSNGANLNFPSIGSLNEYLREKYPDNYVGVVRVHHQSSEWHTELLEMIRTVLE